MINLNTKRIITLLIVLLLVSGCSSFSFFKSSDESDPDISAETEIEIDQGSGISLYNVRLTKDDQGSSTLIGNIRTNAHQRHINGHIDIVIESRSGGTLKNVSTKLDPHVTHQRHSITHPAFRVVLDGSVPPGAIIRVSYHNDDDQSSGNTGCENPHCQ